MAHPGLTVSERDVQLFADGRKGVPERVLVELWHSKPLSDGLDESYGANSEQRSEYRFVDAKTISSAPENRVVVFQLFEALDSNHRQRNKPPAAISVLSSVWAERALVIALPNGGRVRRNPFPVQECRLARQIDAFPCQTAYISARFMLVVNGDKRHFTVLGVRNSLSTALA